MSDISWYETEDGTLTCYNKAYGEHYHNRIGAFTEANGIYVRHAQLSERFNTQTRVTVLDPFFGLGYNSLAIMAEWDRLRQTQFPHACLTLIAIEMDPDILIRVPDIFKNKDLEHLKSFLPLFEHNTYYRTLPDHSDLLINLNALNTTEPVQVILIQGDSRQVVQALPDECINIVFHDAFSPRTQPELWTETLFRQYRRILTTAPRGDVITYSASAPIRKGLQNAGFHVYPLHTSFGKPGTLASTEPRSDYPDFDDLEKALLGCRSAIPYKDNDTLTLTPQEVISQRKSEMESSTLPTSSSIHKQFGYFRNPSSITS